MSKGADRFQARFDLQTGTVSLWRLSDGQANGNGRGRCPAITKPGTYKLGFANVDSRLTVWVDGNLPFQEPTATTTGRSAASITRLDPPTERDPTDPANDPNNLEPASIGAAHGAKAERGPPAALARHLLTRPQPMAAVPARRSLRTMYVQPGHYLCLGDNSSESSDSRYWGLVPQRLLLGRALAGLLPVRPRPGGSDPREAMLTGEIQIRVRYAETDRMGLLHHANYLVYFEQGRTELLRQSGRSYKELEDGGLLAGARQRSRSATAGRPATTTC